MRFFYIAVIFSMFFTSLALADITVTDASGLTRASKRGVESATVVVTFSKKAPNNIELHSSDGLNQDLTEPEKNKKNYTFKAVKSGTWQVSSKNLKYKVSIK